MTTHKHPSVILGSTSIKFDDRFTMHSILPLEKAILAFEPDTVSASIHYPAKSKGFGQGMKKVCGTPYPVKGPVPGVCQVTVVTKKDVKRIAYFCVNDKKVERFIEEAPAPPAPKV